MQRKICLLGTFSVGKTSLTERFVRSIFSDRYHTTVGVRIEKRTVALGSGPLDLIIWDLAGEDEFVKLRPPYLRGASGYLLVADGTRPQTLDKAVEIQARASAILGKVPFILVANKIDRVRDWAADERRMEDLAASGWIIFRTSAKTGEGVDEAFECLAKMVIYGENLGLAG